MNISINNLNKFYGKNIVLDNINLEIGEGMFGLLGPNGAGKTTLMRILTTISTKSGGDITINDIDISKRQLIRNSIGYLPQEFSLYPNMTVYEAMDYMALLSDIKNNKTRKNLVIDLLKKVNLENDLRVKVKNLSGGMKRRLGIAQALLNDPKVLIVDEPTAGLDPEERIRFRNLLRDFSVERIVILSTHIVEDIEFTCENLAILDKGSILYSGKVVDMLSLAKEKVWTIITKREDIDEIRKNNIVISTVSEGDNIRAKVLCSTKPYENAIEANPTIEDAYMQIMKAV
ncbi:ABC transporter ATP-binding protein [Clostridium grantii]|uniref:ABC-2 type transport system ATP-binding protein n=1 Tax=Clostridium grantii DSM 8605 TaxID=1121316 RepID=A0A1M5WTS0_9CLOT|nr:ABC transporter ATP-binding protein [Clostridium grantii]SHH90848.1 ABC-2 type transport system ATP-binding protein [Clostridium grantii DSM 8605]